MDIWFTSDHHFGHANIISFCDRPYDNVDHMNEMLIQNWNSLVKPNDLVYHQGDLCMGKIEKTLPLIKRLNGIIVLIPGNHDKCWHGGRAGHEIWEAKYKEMGIEKIVQTGAGLPEPTLRIGGEECKLSHFPYTGDSHDKGHTDRYNAWRPEDDGSWLIHGHIHNNESKSPKTGHMINVSVDVWDFLPANIDWIAELIAA